ncbi:hypothetical protein P9VFCI_142 [Rhizobium phage P9VFCI]|uniref:Glutaredoxin domain-containing protein n=3 Tax=Innesvirus TaxID=3044739 RepID=A0A076YNJ2_9CAUD|nr:hypothetical protein P10VF_151 [Rhizobium phage vB_RleM_P10VF]YP_010662035.1 hypothetical protein PP937_gp142 [Rhizobium phage P9VFCI]YP_010662333.1 hypothetical protein PP938_gp183 [Rhizobium phage AF3]AIK68364.1 hypothetical protein P10VF_151 [Rhizobium phage vB_RleM_P10VF]QNH71531.1 hypothetical protein AF3_183 [Rhizobium phage AF3]QNH71951.1 hypothetical protein P9VFCI_142 [Rhizobium phage P9VFCI]
MIQIYGIDDCRWCEKTKVLLDTAGKEYSYTQIEDANKQAFMDGFQLVYPDSPRTFPRVTVVVQDPEKFEPVVKLIGGFDEILEEVLHERV